MSFESKFGVEKNYDKAAKILLAAFIIGGYSLVDAQAQESKINIPNTKIEITITDPSDLCGVVNTALCETTCAKMKQAGNNPDKCDEACTKFVKQCRVTRKPDGSITYESGFFKIIIPKNKN